MTFRELLLSGASLDDAYRLAMQGPMNWNHPIKAAMTAPIDVCNCPSHSTLRAQRELTFALKGLIHAMKGVLPLTNEHLVNAQRTLENFGYKE